MASVNEVRLIGYTGDLRFLVLEIGRGNGLRRLRLPIDGDLVATLDEIRDQRDDLPTAESYAADDDSEQSDAVTDGDEAAGAGGSATTAATTTTTDAPFRRTPPEVDPPSDGELETDGTPPEPGAAGDAAAEVDGPTSELTPAQIQALLRSGRSVRSVAKAAGTDVAWVERWLAPIVAEREQVIREARGRRLRRPRLGESRRNLGDAVDANLARRGVAEDEVTWTASRRADGRWSVSVRYRHRGRARSASWTLRREDGQLVASSELARELGWSDAAVRRPRRKATSRSGRR